MTFQYLHGEPEVDIPLQQAGWPSGFSGYRGIALTLESTGIDPLFIGFHNAADKSTDKKEVVIEPLPGIRFLAVIPFDISGASEPQPQPKIAPLGYKIWPEKFSPPAAIKQISFRVKSPAALQKITLCSFELSHDLPQNNIIDRHPVIDRYGQWIAEKWPDKASDNDELKAIWEKEDLRPVKYPYCPLGGDPTHTLKATGFFHTGKIGERWVLVDPHGHSFYSAGIDIVGVADSSFGTDVADREFLYEQLPPPGPAWLPEIPGKLVSFYAANLMRRYGSEWEERGNRRMVQRLRNWGFNTIGNWSNRDFAPLSGMPYVLPLYGWETKKIFSEPYGLPDMFSDEFKQNVDEAARKQCLALTDDSNLIGWFLENEPDWPRDTPLKKSWADIVLDDPEPSATQNKLKELLAAHPAGAEQIKAGFLYDCVRQYLETIIAAVRKYDPNHLILGVRFAGKPAEQWIKLSSLFDVFSANIYTDTLAPDPAIIKEYSEKSGRPVIIGEFTAAAPGRGLQGLFYGVHKVRDQAERGVAYRYYVENSAASRYIIGTHWFQLVDDSPTGRPHDQERLNDGFVNGIDVPYQDLVEAARATHLRLYDLVFGRAKPYDQRPQVN